MEGPSPMCMACARFRPDADGMTCDAYPDGIPHEIVMNQWDHRRPKPGDGGKQFVLREGEDSQPWWPDEAA